MDQSCGLVCLRRSLYNRTAHPHYTYPTGRTELCRSRVSNINSIFTSSSNEMDDIRAGSVASIFGPV